MLRRWEKNPCESLVCSVGSLADRLRDRMRPSGQDDGAKGRDGHRGIHGLRGLAWDRAHGKARQGIGKAWHGPAWHGIGVGMGASMGMGTSSEHGQLNNLAGPDDPAWRSRNKGGDRRGQRGRARGKIEPEECLRVCVRAHVVRSATDVERLGK